MKILAMDTSSRAASCALWEDGILLAESFLNIGLTHSQTAMPLLTDLLDRTGTALQSLDALAVTAGPGSFTGLRIGLSAVKGLSLGTGIPCIPVSTLESLAWNLTGTDGYLVPAMDARRRQVYTALFHSRGGIVSRIAGDQALSLDALQELLHSLEPGVPITLVGDGAELCMKELGSRFSTLRLAPQALRHQRAGSVAALAAEKETVTADLLEPVYLRLPQAERERKQKEAEAHDRTGK